MINIGLIGFGYQAHYCSFGISKSTLTGHRY